MSSDGISLKDVRNEAMSAIQELKAGEMDVKTASEIRNILNTIIDTAKVQVEFLKALPEPLKAQFEKDEIKAIAGTLKDSDAEMDLIQERIKRSRNNFRIKN